MAEPLAAALLAAQLDMRNPSLDASNPHFRSRYASLSAVLSVVRPALEAHGLRLAQAVSVTEAGPVLSTVVHDAAGNDATLCSMPIPQTDDVQRMGSAITYARRYSLLCAFALVGDDDDDGEAAGAPNEPPAQGEFTVRCRTCGKSQRISSRERYAAFLASDKSRCCAHPDWRVQ